MLESQFKRFPHGFQSSPTRRAQNEWALSVISDARLLSETLWIAIWCLLLVWLIIALTRIIGARRPGLTLGAPLAVAAIARLGVAAIGSLNPALARARSRTDEEGFLKLARQLADERLSLHSLFSNGFSDFHVWFMALQLRITDAPGEFFLRIGHIALAITALAILAVATYDLAGAGAAKLLAWFLALEPSNVFFSGLLHKEAPMFLGESLVILGCVRMFKRRDWQAFVLMGIGLVFAGVTRPYIAFALATACALISLHASARRLGFRNRRSPALAIAVVIGIGGAIIISPAPSSVFDDVQLHQNAYVSDESNLKLEPVDLSTPEAIARSGIRRILDFLLRPYPWQVANISQQLGVLGTAIAWCLFMATLVLAAAHPREAASRLPPIAYVVILLAGTYALATANSGTGFRYRTHILFGLAPAVAVLIRREDAAPGREARYDEAGAEEEIRDCNQSDRRAHGDQRLCT